MPPHVYRVLLLGDSGVARPSTRPWRAMSMLRGHSGDSVGALRVFTAAADRVIAGPPAHRLAGLMGPGLRAAPGRLAAGLLIRQFVRDLEQSGVDAVSLASPAVTDLDSTSFDRLRRALTNANIIGFGAGATFEDAHQPHRMVLPQEVGAGELHLHSSVGDTTPAAEASDEVSAGRLRTLCATAADSRVPNQVREPHDMFRVALPSFGGQTRWRSLAQFQTAEKLLEEEYDLVLGQGPAAGQEVLRSRRRWVVHSMGTCPSSMRGQGSGNSPTMDPFSFWTMLEISCEQRVRTVRLKLYPVLAAADRAGADDLQPFGESELAAVVESLNGRSPNGWSFDNPSRSTGQDELGWYIQLNLGPWPVGESPQRAPGLLEDGDPDETQPFRTYASIRQGLERFSPDRHLGSSLNAEAAEKAGAEIEWVSAKLALATQGERTYFINGYMAHSSQVGAEACTDKYQTHKLLTRAGVPVVRAALVGSAHEAWKAAGMIGRPVVIKPADRDRARGVSVNLTTRQEIETAYRRARQISRRVMVEQHIDIETEMRVMASDSECASITERILPEVWGDGFSTVQQLIEERNLHRSSIFSLKGKEALIDDSAARHIAEQGYDLQDVPKGGSVITVGAIGGQSSGGDIAERTHRADAKIRSAAVAAVRAIPSLRWGGVDLMIERHTGNVYVLEVNSRSGYGSATFPSSGTPKDVAGRAWQLRVEHAEGAAATNRGSVFPILAERRGTPLKSLPYAADENLSLARLLFAFAEHQGYRVSRRGPRLRQLVSAGGEEQMFTSQGLSSEDFAVSVRVLNQFGSLRRVLGVAQVPQVWSRSVSDARKVESLLPQLRNATITPFQAPWGGKQLQSLDSGQAELLDFTGRWILQERPLGHRLRVLAFSDGAVAVTSQTSQVAATLLTCAQRLALQAVRAVPQLRWAMVDVVVPGEGHVHLPPTGAVEGMSLAPRFSSEEFVVAGDLGCFFQRLLGERCAD